MARHAGAGGWQLQDRLRRDVIRQNGKRRLLFAPNRRVGKGVGSAAPQTKVSRTPCPRVLAQLPIMTAWVRRTRDFAIGKFRASAFAHPTRLCMFVESKENRALFRLWASGAASPRCKTVSGFRFRSIRATI